MPNIINLMCKRNPNRPGYLCMGSQKDGVPISFKATKFDLDDVDNSFSHIYIDFETSVECKAKSGTLTCSREPGIL